MLLQDLALLEGGREKHQRDVSRKTQALPHGRLHRPISGGVYWLMDYRDFFSGNIEPLDKPLVR